MASANLGRYCTRDVISDPPTSVMIVHDIPAANGVASDVYFVAEADVEITEGWNTRLGKSQLSICFMHSFGKCSGRCNSDPSTCHQIHIRRDALDAVRSTYRNRTRTLFSRTIKAHLGEELRLALSRVARKDLTLKYLEYRAQDVEETAGLKTYEAAYRSWLLSPAGAPDTFHDTAVFQCPSFATTGRCDTGVECQGIHGDVRNAQVRDHVVANALRQLAILVPGAANAAPTPKHPAHAPRHALPPPPFNAFVHQHQQPMFVPYPHAYTQMPAFLQPQMPAYVQAPQPAMQPMYFIVMPQAPPGYEQHAVPQHMAMPMAAAPQAIAFAATSPANQLLSPQVVTALKTVTPGERSPETLSVVSDPVTDAADVPTASCWGDDVAVHKSDDMFHAFRSHFSISGGN